MDLNNNNISHLTFIDQQLEIARRKKIGLQLM